MDMRAPGCILLNLLLQFIAAKMRESDIWRNASEVEFDNAMEGMEKLVMNKLYDLFVTPRIHLPSHSHPVTAPSPLHYRCYLLPVQ